jgi:hypothetical protein
MPGNDRVGQKDFGAINVCNRLCVGSLSGWSVLEILS